MKAFYSMILVLAIAVATTQGQSKHAEVDTLMKNGKFAAAKSLLDKLIAKNPGNDTLLTKRGISYYELDKIQLSYDDLSAAIKANPQMANAYLYRGRVFLSSNENSEAINDLNMAIRHASDDSVKINSYLTRASARMMMRQLEGAIEDAKAVLAIDSNNIPALNNMGMSLDQLGRHDEGLESLYKIAAIDSTIIYVPMNIGFIMISMERYAEAIEWIDKALQIDNAQPLAYNNRGYAKLKLGRPKEALTDINKSLSIKEKNNYAYRNRALVYLELNEKVKACLDLQKSLDLGFTEQYGNEVKDLYRTNCVKD
ncbi:MAG: tetratricopeptide repeat protein [Bacteroidota bacterium]|nr:tetratricopeptide repeat protein [Bacteroidota bacterium]